GVERTPWGTSLAWAPRSAEEESRPESTATTVSPSGTSAASRPAAGAASLAAGAGSMSLVRSKTAPPSTAPTTRRTAQTARTTARRRAASRPVRWSRRPSAMTVLLVENVGGSVARGAPTRGEHPTRGPSAVGPRSRPGTGRSAAAHGVVRGVRLERPPVARCGHLRGARLDRGRTRRERLVRRDARLDAGHRLRPERGRERDVRRDRVVVRGADRDV